jgi:hypothetical protein
MIRKFINENNLEFTEGRRNSDCVIIIGFAQYLKITMKQLKEALIKEIEEDSFIAEEIERLWNYCKSHNYADYWTKEIAKQTYKF